MSNQSTQKVAVPLDALVSELAEARKYIEILGNQINQLSNELAEVIASREFISELNARKAKELIIPADRRGHVMIKATPLTEDRVITHVGLEYYVELPLDKAVEVLSKKESDIKRTIEALQTELDSAIRYYQQLQAVVNTALVQIKSASQSSK